MEKQFYQLLHQSDIMNNYFNKKYIISITENTAYQLETKETQTLDSFYKKYPIKRLLKKEFTMQTKDNYLLIKNSNEYFLLLESIHYLEEKLIYQLPQDAIALFGKEAIYSSKKNKPYIIYFHFDCNQDLEDENINNRIMLLLQDTIPYLSTYFYRRAMNHYFLYIFEGHELEIIDLLLLIRNCFINIEEFYIKPYFYFTQIPKKNVIQITMELLQTNATLSSREEKKAIHFIPYKALSTL